MPAFLFDMDGVVVDNMRFHERAWIEFLGRLGVSVERGEFMRTAGMPTRDVLSHFLGRPLAAEEARRFHDEKEAFYREICRPHLAPAAGLLEFVGSSRREGVRLGLGTGSTPGNIDFVLDGLGLRPAFDAVVGAHEVSRGKPDPETFLRLAEKLGVRPEDCVVFEDSLLGERAARAAGMRVVAVTTSHRADEFAGPDLAVADFRGLAVARIAALGR